MDVCFVRGGIACRKGVGRQCPAALPILSPLISSTHTKWSSSSRMKSQYRRMYLPMCNISIQHREKGRIGSQPTCMSSRRVFALSVSIRRANELPKGTSALSISLPQIPKPSLLFPLKRRYWRYCMEGKDNITTVDADAPVPTPLPIKFCSLDCLLYHLEVTALPTLSQYRY